MTTPRRIHVARRTRLLLIMAASILFSLGLLAARIIHTGTGIYSFLTWNLLLAAVPFCLSTVLVRFVRLQSSKLALPGVLGLWLLFFPNAPYIVTAFVHLKARTGAPVWFDLILITSFSWTGLLLGFISLSDLQEIIRRRCGQLTASAFALAALTSAAFGIYLGRFLRWNSWDLLTRPNLLLRDVAERVLDPLAHPTAVAVTALMSVLLSLWYLAFRTAAEPRPAMAKGSSESRGLDTPADGW